MYPFAAPDDKVDAGVVEYGCCETIFDMEGAERVEISFSCIGFDFLHEYGKPMCDRFDGGRERCVLMEGAQGFV